MAMSDEHKEALAQGRRESRAIKSYLAALGERRPGRPVTADSLQRRLAAVGAKLQKESQPLKRVALLQSRIDLQERLSKVHEASNMAELERNFIEQVGAYSERKGVSYEAWREFGVPAKVLKEAGLSRSA
ncbi:MAG: hypothetical protein ACR2JP_05060 [Acidimicrobiia bacterium]